MGTEVGSLYVTIGAQMDGVKKGLAETERLLKQTAGAAQTSGNEVAAGADKMGLSLGKLASVAKGLATAGVVAAIANEIKGTVDATMKWGASVDTLTDMFGMSGREASTWSVAMQHVGLSVQEGGMQLNYFTRMLAEANEKMAAGEVTPFSTALAKLGVAAQDSSGQLKSFDALMPEIMDAFKALPAGVEASAVAMDMFGARGGSKFLDFLRQGSEGLTEAGKKAGEFGLAIDSLESDKIEQFGFKVNDLGMRFEGLKVKIGMGLIDPLIGAMDLVDKLSVKVEKLGTTLQSKPGQWGMTGESDLALRAALGLGQKPLTAGELALLGIHTYTPPPVAGMGDLGAYDASRTPFGDAGARWAGAGKGLTGQMTDAQFYMDSRSLLQGMMGGTGAGGSFGGGVASALSGGTDFASLLAKAFGGNLGAAQGWQGAFASQHGGAAAGITDIRDKMAGDAFFARTGRAATDEEWQKRYYSGGFEGEDKTGLDAIFGPAGTLATKLDEQKAAEDKHTQDLIAAFARETSKTLTVQFAGTRITDNTPP